MVQLYSSTARGCVAVRLWVPACAGAAHGAQPDRGLRGASTSGGHHRRHDQHRGN